MFHADATMLLRAYAAFIDLLVTTLIAAPLQWVFVSADEMALFWIVLATMHVAMIGEFGGTLGMKLLGLVATQKGAPPPLWMVAYRWLLAFGPVVAGFFMAAQWPDSQIGSVLAPLAIAAPAAIWVLRTLRPARDGAPPAQVFWDRLTGISVIRV